MSEKTPSYYTSGGEEYRPDIVADKWNTSRRVSHVLAYLCRAGKKPGASYEQDLTKAIDMLQKEIAAKPAPQPEATAEIEIWVPKFRARRDGSSHATYKDRSCIIRWSDGTHSIYNPVGAYIAPPGEVRRCDYETPEDAARALAAAGFGPAKCQKPKGVKHD